jgi:prepilin-type N-terminal cleavage/methylation domain-containing protein
VSDNSQQSILHRRAFSLVEVVVATLIVGVMMVAAMNSLGAFIRGQQRMANQSRGWHLAQELASEILACLYEEPDETPQFGRESGESAGVRTAYDDIDDYHGWTESPPEARDGTPVAELVAWSRSVSVERVSLANPNLTVATDQGLKRITISVSFQNEIVAQLTALRAKAWQEPPFN